MKRSWQSERFAQLRRIAADLSRQYSVTVRRVKSIRGLANIMDGERIIWAPPVRGYVSFAVFCHEIGHHALGQFERKSPTWKEELAAWKFAKDTFAEHDIKWVQSVQALVRSCLARMIAEDLKPEQYSMMSPELRALKILEDAGM